MANPILSQSDTFNRRGYAPYQAQPYQQYPYQQQYPGQPYQGGQYGQAPWQQPSAPTALMTYDDVIAKTGLALLGVAAAAFASYKYFAVNDAPALMMGALLISAIVGFVTVLVVAGRRRVSPVGVMIYALVEGVFIGVFTLLLEARYPGIALQAVTGTFAAAAATLIAYRFFHIRVSNRFRKWVFITTLAFAALMLVNLVLSLVGLNTGIAGFGPLGFVFALLGAGLAVFNLIMDFDYVDRAVANQAPATESWRAALGITVTMVWLYTEILRILSYLRR